MRYGIVLLCFLACAGAAPAEGIPVLAKNDTLTQLYADTSQWRELVSDDSVFGIRYPSEFKAESRNGIHISHSIPFEHVNPCYFGEEPRELLQELVDFDIRLRVAHGDLTRLMVMDEPGLATRLWIDDSLQIPPDFRVYPDYADSTTVGSLSGYRVHHGIEGCGHATYWFVGRNGQVLIVDRRYITELEPIIRNYKENRKLIGVIVPDKEEEVFQRILSTFKYLE